MLAQKYKLTKDPELSKDPEVVPAPLPYTGKRRGRKPGVKSTAKVTTYGFQREEKEIDVEFS